MKNKITKLSLILLVSSFAVNAQDVKSKEQILSVTNVKALNQFEVEIKKETAENLRKAYELAERMGKPISGIDESGYKYQLIGVDEQYNELLYYRTFNNIAKGSSLQTANAKPLQALGLTGKGINVGVWDGGAVLSSHFSLAGRVQIKENKPTDDHATHVSGTIAANDFVPDAKGFATEAIILSYEYNGDIAEMTPESKNLLVSNHSYGLDASKAGAVIPGIFGRYDSRSAAYDIIANNAPMYTMVFAAGNDRKFKYNPTKSGRDLLSWGGVSKNTIVVAATKGTENFTEVAGINSPMNFLSDFSSWGPTDDFRIKPDIAAKGSLVFSITNTGNAATDIMSGTSMAAPAVTGVVVLWQEYFNQLFGRYMRSATVRAIMAHSAREAGEAEGPDYKFGWGLINADGGAQVMRDKTQKRAVLAELKMTQGQELVYDFAYDGKQPLIATIAWNDPAGDPLNTTDTNYPALINDLDIKVINVDNNQEFLPWGLSHSWTSEGGSIARRMVNDRDNIERVNVNSLLPGNYKVVINHKGNLKGGGQEFSLVISGAGTIMNDIGDLSSKKQMFKRLNLYPNPANDIVNLEGDINELQGANIVLYDITGKKIIDKTNAFQNTIESLNISNLPQGMYLLDISNNGKRQVMKFIKD